MVELHVTRLVEPLILIRQSNDTAVPNKRRGQLEEDAESVDTPRGSGHFRVRATRLRRRQGIRIELGKYPMQQGVND